MDATSSLRDALARCVDRRRLIDTATRLVAVPSRTREGGAVADCLADVLRSDGFRVERRAATWKATVRRAGPPVHEVMRPPDEPNVLAAGAELVGRLMRLGDALAAKEDPVAGRETVFVGQFHGGEIYNQYPQECWLEG